MGGWDAPWHWVILAIVVIALFGYKKLPDASRSLGRSLRIFKTEIKGMSEDDKARAAAKDKPAGGDVPAEAPAPRVRELPRAEVVRNEAPRPRPQPGASASTATDTDR
ncbi:Sec-independent protein translocase subunit TatA [uncultured Jatrophihabitans sp.]|uniref:Sec-independent protein translocase subunit TatA n=1 Tax=uncultured Jatrophihabitans sp. TaxID=1610747 RepID=UPI0035CB3F89